VVVLSGSSYQCALVVLRRPIGCSEVREMVAKPPLLNKKLRDAQLYTRLGHRFLNKICVSEERSTFEVMNYASKSGRMRS
jgi:hypothetical protein